MEQRSFTFSVPQRAGEDVSAEPLIERGIECAESVSLRAAVHWRKDFEVLLSDHPELGTLEKLLQDLGKAATPQGAHFRLLQLVEFWWRPEKTWYPGVIRGVHSDGTVDVECAVEGWYGSTLAAVHPSNVRDCCLYVHDTHVDSGSYRYKKYHACPHTGKLTPARPDRFCVGNTTTHVFTLEMGTTRV